MLGWLEHCRNFDGGEIKTSLLNFLKKTRGVRQLYIYFFFDVLNSSTQNIQFLKNQTHYTYM